MSIQKWHHLVGEKSAVDHQTRGIRQRFRANRINKEFGKLSGEELLKPITRRLDRESTFQQTRQESPDYTMDQFDGNNPFGVEFRPDAPLPPSSSSLPSSPSPPDYGDDDDDLPRKEWGLPGPVEPEYLHESTLLQTVDQLITKCGDDPNYMGILWRISKM